MTQNLTTTCPSSASLEKAVQSVSTVADVLPLGLTKEEVLRRQSQFGPNAMPDEAPNLWRMAFGKFWAPIPWMLEAAILIQLALCEYVESIVISFLLVFNAALGFFQEGTAQATLTALKSRLALNASVSRDGVWTRAPATDLVPSDILKLSLGGVVAADVRILSGSILLDQSMLTRDSIPIEAAVAGPALTNFVFP